MNMPMRARRLLCVIATLGAWKIVRADWVVVAPYWFHDSDPPASDHYGQYPVSLPVSPLWRPPNSDQIDPSNPTQWRDAVRHATPLQSWDELFPGGGAWGITGPPQVKPNGSLIAVKLAGGFMILYPTVLVFSHLHRRRMRFTKSSPDSPTPDGSQT